MRRVSRARARAAGASVTVVAAVGLHCMARDLPLPELETRFHDTRRWRFDFAWPRDMIALECEGGTWTHGRHSRGAGFARDCEKYAHAAMLGWRVIRATPAQIRAGVALDWVAGVRGRVS